MAACGHERLAESVQHRNLDGDEKRGCRSHKENRHMTGTAGYVHAIVLIESGLATVFFVLETPVNLPSFCGARKRS
jgi:hypothetical protein